MMRVLIGYQAGRTVQATPGAAPSSIGSSWTRAGAVGSDSVCLA